MLINSFALIVLNYKNYKLTIKNVDIVIENNEPFNIIIVDNNSENESYTVLQEYYSNNKYLHVIYCKENGGYAKGNNFGLKYLEKIKENIKYIGIMNPDVNCFKHNVFLNLVLLLKDNNKIGLIAPVMIERNGINLKKIAWKLPTFKDLFLSQIHGYEKFFKSRTAYQYLPVENDLAYVDVVQGSLLIIRFELFKEIGLFDENTFMYFEENIVAKKILKNGYKICISLKDFYLHEHEYIRSNFKASIIRKRVINKSMNYYIKSYLNTPLYKRAIIYVLEYIDLYIVNAMSHLLHKLK